MATNDYLKKKPLEVKQESSPNSQTVNITEDNTKVVDDNNDSRYTFTAEAATVPSSLTVYIQTIDNTAKMNVRLYKNGNKVYDEVKDKTGNSSVTWNFDISNISAIWESGDTIGFEIDADTSEAPGDSKHEIERDPESLAGSELSGPLVSKNDNSDTWSSGTSSSELTMKAVTTQDKAQPVLVGGEKTLFNTSTSGTVKSSGSYTVDLTGTRGYISTIYASEDQNGVDESVKIEIKDNQSNILASKSQQGWGNVDDAITVNFSKNDFSRVPEDEVITVEWVEDSGNQGASGLVSKDTGFTQTQSGIDIEGQVLFDNGGINSSASGDALEITNDLGESTTGTGGVVIDDSNVSGKSDLAVYDQNGNLLDFEIESIKSYTNDVFNNSGGTVSPPVTFDIDIGGRPAILKELAVLVSDQNTNQSLTITDSGNNTLASTTNFSHPGANNVVFSLSESDYSRVPENETITVEVDSGAASIGVDTSFSANERLFSISSGQDVVYSDIEGGSRSKNIVVEDTFSGDNYVLWAYNSWTRDDSVQAQVVYGDGPASSEENVSGTWSNTGQNAVMVQHLQDEPLTATDSTSNNNDGTVNGATSTTGEFDGAASFDGTDDYIDVPVSFDDVTGSNNDITVASFCSTSSSSRFAIYRGYNGQDFINHNMDSGSLEFKVRADENGTTSSATGGSGFDDGKFHSIVGTYSDNDGARIYGDGSQQGSDPSTLSNSISGSLEPHVGAQNLEGSVTDNFPGDIDAFRLYNEVKSSDWVQADYDASPKGGQVYFSQQAAEDTLTFNGVTTTASASGTGGTTSISGSTTANTSTATASGSGNTIFIEPDFATLSANGAGTGATISISGSSTLDITEATATGAGGTSNLTQLLATTTASATGTGSTLEFDRLSGTVDVEGQPTSGVDVNIVDKTNNVLYETTTDSNGDWIIDAGDGVVYQVAYLFDDGTTYYGDAEESDTT